MGNAPDPPGQPAGQIRWASRVPGWNSSSTGTTRGDYVSVESGLKAGDRVVSSGIFKLRNGMAVVENNELKPPSNLAPKPADS